MSNAADLDIGDDVSKQVKAMVCCSLAVTHVHSMPPCILAIAAYGILSLTLNLTPDPDPDPDSDH
jgi:hypothetical protein